MLSRLTVIALLSLTTLAIAADAPAKKKRPATRPSTQAALQPYPLKTCVVSGEAFGGEMGDPVVFAHEGREIKLCCEGCLKKFHKNADKHLKTLDEAAKANKAQQDQKKDSGKPAA
jgi:hypothetical protein